MLEKNLLPSTSSHQAPPHIPKERERKRTRVPLLEAIRPQILPVPTKAFVISCRKGDNAESSNYFREVQNLEVIEITAAFWSPAFWEIQGLWELQGALNSWSTLISRGYAIGHLFSKTKYFTLTIAVGKSQLQIELSVCSWYLGKFIKSPSETEIYWYIEKEINQCFANDSNK